MIFLITFLLLTQVMSIASALGGGVALTTQQVGEIAGRYLSRGGNAAGRGLLSGATRGWSAVGRSAAGRGIRSSATRGWSAVKNRFNRRTHGRQKITFTPVERR